MIWGAYIANNFSALEAGCDAIWTGFAAANPAVTHNNARTFAVLFIADITVTQLTVNQTAIRTAPLLAF